MQAQVMWSDPVDAKEPCSDPKKPEQPTLAKILLLLHEVQKVAWENERIVNEISFSLFGLLSNPNEVEAVGPPEGSIPGLLYQSSCILYKLNLIKERLEVILAAS